MNGLLSKGGLAGLFALVFSCVSVADVIVVAPGVGTLETAVAGANSGDVLELVTGMYGGAAFTVDKSLTVRAQTSSDSPVVSLSGTLSVGATGTVQTWQRIEFQGMSVTPAGSGSEVTFQGATFNSAPLVSLGSSIRVIESVFNESDLGCFNGNCGGSNWVFIGNEVHATSNLELDLRNGGELIFAGNTITYDVPQSVNFISGSSAIVIGNVFNLEETTSVAMFVGSSASELQFHGNRVNARFDQSFGDTVASPKIFEFAPCPGAQIRNNLFRLVDTSGLSTTAGGSRVTGINAIRLKCGTASEISNNIIDYGDFDLGVESSPDNGAIHLEQPAVVQANIFTNLLNRPQFTFDPSTVTANRFLNNLCFDTSQSCTNLDGNQDEVDPLFVDTVDYVLNAVSPAIDAGPDNPFLIDTDGSMADLGIHGGLFPIDQFDIQRTPGRTAPFVFPLFNASADVDSFGNVQIKVIGAARLR